MSDSVPFKNNPYINAITVNANTVTATNLNTTNFNPQNISTDTLQATSIESEGIEALGIIVEEIAMAGCFPGYENITSSGNLSNFISVSLIANTEATTHGLDNPSIEIENINSFGFYKTIVMTNFGGNAVINPSSPLLTGTTITLTGVGNSVTLFYNGTVWIVINNNGATIS